MQILQPQQLWAPNCRNSRQFKLTGCTRGCEIGFTVASTQSRNQVNLCCSLGNNDGVSSFKPNQKSLYTMVKAATILMWSCLLSDLKFPSPSHPVRINDYPLTIIHFLPSPLTQSRNIYLICIISAN